MMLFLGFLLLSLLLIGLSFESGGGGGGGVSCSLGWSQSDYYIAKDDLELLTLLLPSAGFWSAGITGVCHECPACFQFLTVV